MSRYSIHRATRTTTDFLDRWVGVGLVVFAILSGGLYVWQVEREGDRADCQARYNQAFAEQITTRARLTAASDEAQSDLLLGVARLFALPQQDQSRKAQVARAREFRALLSGFAAEAERVSSERKNTPLPPIPDC